MNKLIRGWKMRAWTGWGVANVDYAFESIDWPICYQHDVYVDKAHSVLLEVLVTTGLVGLILYMLMVSGVGVGLRGVEGKGFQWILSVVLLLYVIHSQTNVIPINEEVLFWVVLGAKQFSVG